MKRAAGSIVFSGLLVLAAAAACDGEPESACKVDTDCPQGTICREERCGPVSAEAGTGTPADAAQATCTGDGLSCITPDECCARVCTAGLCGAPPPPPPTCRGLYELCQNDCCDGLTCTNGACR